MAEKHAVVRLDNMSGTKDGSLLKSVKVYKSDAAVAIDNAQLVVLGDREGREVYKATAPVAASKVSDLVLIASEELFYDETSTHYLTEWKNEAGSICRGYKLHNGDIFSATAEAFNKAPTVGKFVGFAADDTKIQVQAAADDKTFGKIASSEKVGFGNGAYEYFEIDVAL